MKDQSRTAAGMYLASVVLLLLILPVASVLVEHVYLQSAVPLLALVGKWFVFWSAGVRLFLAGLSQLLRPRFTTERVFGMTSDDPLPFVQELGAANFAVGCAGIASLVRPDFVLPVAIIAAIFYAIAGVRHLIAGSRTGNETVAMLTDLFVAGVFSVYVVGALMA